VLSNLTIRPDSLRRTILFVDIGFPLKGFRRRRPFAVVRKIAMFIFSLLLLFQKKLSFVRQNILLFTGYNANDLPNKTKGSNLSRNKEFVRIDGVFGIVRGCNKSEAG